MLINSSSVNFSLVLHSLEHLSKLSLESFDTAKDNMALKLSTVRMEGVTTGVEGDEEEVEAVGKEVVAEKEEEEEEEEEEELEAMACIEDAEEERK